MKPTARQPAPCPCLPRIARVCVVRKKMKFVVEPPIAFLPPGGDLRVFNTTCEQLEIRLRRADRDVLIEPGEGRAFKQGNDTGIFSYQIWMVDSKKWAKGNSDPRIIIDNP